LPGGDAFALFEALALLTLLRFMLPAFGFQRLRRALLELARRTRFRGARRLDARRLVWAVETGRRHCPVGSACLSEALTAETLFCQHGYEPVLCIGARREGGVFTAHAWIENAGAVVIGGPAAVTQEYRKFPSFTA
jgi:hypothetical protein